MTNLINADTASTKELVAFYNANCECFGKKQVKKFADRETAQLRVRQMVADIEAEQEELKTSAAPSQLAMCLGLVPPSAAVEGLSIVKADTHTVEHNDVYGYESHGKVNCPSCGVHLSNGVGVHNYEVNGKKIKHEEFEYCCLGCGFEFGDSIGKDKRSVTAVAGEAREAMKTSLKLDRTITCVETGEVFKNAFQMWKAHSDWMTSAQQDSLTAKLYKAAKAGEQLSVTINGRTFHLVNV